MEKNIIVNDELIISKELTFRHFRESSFFAEQSDSMFFWLKETCTINQSKRPLKVGMCFKDNLLKLVELFCIDSYSDLGESEKIHKEVASAILSETNLNGEDLNVIYDKRNNYISIIIHY